MRKSIHDTPPGRRPLSALATEKEGRDAKWPQPQPVSFRVLGGPRRQFSAASGGVSNEPAPDNVTAVVVTHRRPRLAGELVRTLLSKEGFTPDRIIVVVSGEGGLDDLALEASVRMVRLATNVGPAGGFRAGLLAAFDDPATRWAYLCE